MFSWLRNIVSPILRARSCARIYPQNSNNNSNSNSNEYEKKIKQYLDDIKNRRCYLKSIDEQYRTHEICFAAVQQSGVALFDVPGIFKTYTMCMEAVKEYGCALQCVPDNHKTYELCKTAIQQNGIALRHSPLKLYELCKIAVTRSGTALEFVPIEHKTPEICLLAVKNNGMAIKFVPDQTEQLCLEAAKQYGYSVTLMDDDNKTYEIYLAAAQNFGYIMRYMPVHMQTPELCVAALSNDLRAFEYIKIDFEKNKIEHLFTENNLKKNFIHFTVNEPFIDNLYKFKFDQQTISTIINYIIQIMPTHSNYTNRFEDSPDYKRVLEISPLIKKLQYYNYPFSREQLLELVKYEIQVEHINQYGYDLN